MAAFAAEKNGHELIHPGVGEKQIGRVRHERRRGHNRVLLFAKEIEKTLTNLGTGHDAEIKRDISGDARTTAMPSERPHGSRGRSMREVRRFRALHAPRLPLFNGRGELGQFVRA